MFINATVPRLFRGDAAVVFVFFFTGFFLAIRFTKGTSSSSELLSEDEGSFSVGGYLPVINWVQVFLSEQSNDSACSPFSFGFVFLFLAEVFRSVGAFASFLLIAARDSSSETSLGDSAYLTRTNKTSLVLCYEKSIFDFHDLTLTRFIGCAPSGLHDCSCFSGCFFLF